MVRHCVSHLNRPLTVGICLGLMLAALTPLPMSAHHSIDAVYDRTKSAEFTVTITKVEWLNPHAHFYANVSQADVNETGAPGRKGREWLFELGSPNKLMQKGWTRYTLKPGDQVKVTAIPARNGDRQASVQMVTWRDGRTIANFDLFDR